MKRTLGMTMVRLLIGFFLGSIILFFFFVFHEYLIHSSPFGFRGFLLTFLFGGSSGVVISYLLIRNRRNTELLKDSEKKYRTLIDLSLDGIYIESERGDILDCNTQGHEMFGYTREEMLKLSIRDLVPPEFRNLLPEIIPDDMATGDVYLERENIKKDGTIFPTEINTKFVTLNGERRLIAYVKDNTEKKKVEKALREREVKLQELNATKDRILSIIAHDLKNQFNTIIGYSDIIKDESNGLTKETMMKYAWEVNRTAIFTHELLENLLGWAMLQKEIESYNPVVFNLKSQVGKVIETLSTTAAVKQIDLVNRIDENFDIFADRMMLRTVVRNLISNAIKFTHRDGDVEILASKETVGNQVTIEIRDTGVGMSAERLDQLFKVGKKYTSLGTEQETGTGLGLAVCKEFVERHGGEIYARSKENLGTSFFIEFPAE